jgi:hypothetical protein
MRKLLFISKLLFIFSTLNARHSGITLGGMPTVSNKKNLLKTIESNVFTVLPSLTVCPDELVNVAEFVRNNGVEKALRWENSNSGIGLGSSGVGQMPNFVAVNPTDENLVATINYLFVQSNGYVATFSFNLIVRPKPMVFLKAVNATVCNETPYNQSLAYVSKGATFGFTNDNPSVNFTKNITCDGLNVMPAMAKLTPQIANISITPTLNGCSGAPQFLQMSVLPNPSVKQPNDSEVCSGESISVLFKGLFVGTTFDWINDNPSINLPAEGSGHIENQTVTNFTGVYQLANITVIPRFNGCEGAPKHFKIVVKPAPILATPTFSFCVNDSVHIELKTNLKAALTTTFAWSSSNSTTGMPMNGDAPMLDFLAKSNNPTEIITSYLTVLIAADGCQATTQMAVNIKPRPVLLNPGNFFINSGQQVNIHFLSNIEGANFDWTSEKNAIGLQPTGSGDLKFLATMNTSNLPITTKITATPNFKGCAEQAQMFAITLLPTPSISTPLATVPNKVNK